MLLEFRCSNFKSIKEEIRFSMIAGKDDTSEELLKVYNNFRVLRSAVIYGANGSGKSNFINALLFMCNLVQISISYQPGQKIPQAAHKLSEKENPSTFDIQFIRNNVRYAYGFSIEGGVITEEYLYYFPNGRQVKIFERDRMNIQPGNRYKSSFDVSIKDVLKENRLFLSCAANYSNVRELEEAFLFYTTDIVIYNPSMNNWTEYSIRLMQDNPSIKEEFLQMLNALDTGIQDVKLKVEKVKFTDLKRDLQLPDNLMGLIPEQEGNRIEAKVVYDQFEIDLLSEESSGIKRLFEIICPMIDILNTGKVLICDELEASLHEAVIYKIVQLFQNYKKDIFAQLIFSTHDTSLLNRELFRRDQVWFTQLNKDRATDLYSLVEIKDVRKSENLAKGYVSGKYGAIPMLNHVFFRKAGKDGEE
ncbi:ATP-binding protein [Drancourtella massiliensis]|uniref:ATP-binding protein n=1 Tax=Drancourtella massiliensis TaxID=1632013 RepID=A0ABS2EJ51_9FIRM|nr:ATP-binding protein [Drancourtella massiliensis]MBM6744996.1 ATP-binding protein [Drancourtella massiliensis]